MSLPKSLHKYNDIDRDLHTIMQTMGRRRVFSSPARAQRWRMRAYMYRRLLEEQDEGGGSLFSSWIFRITKAEPNIVTILTEPPDDGWLEDADGNRIEPLASPQDAALQAQADAFKATMKERGFVFDDEPAPSLNSGTTTEDDGPSDVERNQFGFDAFDKGK